MNGFLSMKAERREARMAEARTIKLERKEARQTDRKTDRQADKKSLIAFLILNINLNLEHGMLSLEFLIIEQALKN